LEFTSGTRNTKRGDRYRTRRRGYRMPKEALAAIFLGGIENLRKMFERVRKERVYWGGCARMSQRPLVIRYV